MTKELCRGISVHVRTGLNIQSFLKLKVNKEQGKETTEYMVNVTYSNSMRANASEISIKVMS